MANIEERIKIQLERGKISLAKESIKEMFLVEDRAEFESAMKVEYDGLYPQYRDMTDSEKSDEYIQYMYGMDALDFTIEFSTEDYEYPKVLVDYSEDESYVTFTDWLNETRVISEAIEATYDEDGLELTPYIAEVTELVRPYTQPDVTDKVEEYLKQRYAELRKSAYPTVEEQMDMMYKDSLDGGTRFIEAIKTIKDRFPK